MGFGGGGGAGPLPAHVHNAVPLQGGPLDFANDTISNLNACKLKKYEKKQLIGKMKYMVRHLE